VENGKGGIKWGRDLRHDNLFTCPLALGIIRLFVNIRAISRTLAKSLIIWGQRARKQALAEM